MHTSGFEAVLIYIKIFGVCNFLHLELVANWPTDYHTLLIKNMLIT